jgi:hypothetical protein
MLSATRHKKLLLALLLLAGSAVVAFAAFRIRESVLFSRLSPTEKKIVGAWSWTYLEGVGRMIFTADHGVKAGFPPEDPDKPAIRDRDFTYLSSGMWHVEGDVLVTDINNQLLIDLAQRRGFLNWLFSDPPSYKPEFDRKVRRERIVSLGDDKIVFEGNHSPLERVHR